MSPNRCDGLLARVDFPLYTLQTLTNRHVIVAGGGGAAATGVANGFEIFELSHNGTRFVAEEVMRHETGPNVVMNCSVQSNKNKTYLTAGQESHCQLYKVNIRMVDAAEMRRGSFRAENGLVRRRRRTVSENDNISKKDSNSNTTEKRISFEIRPSDSVQTDFSPCDTSLVSIAKDGLALLWATSAKRAPMLQITCQPPNGNKYLFRRCRFGLIEDKKNEYRMFTIANPLTRSGRQRGLLQSWEPQTGALRNSALANESLSALAVRDDGRFRVLHVKNAHNMFVTGLEFLPVRGYGPPITSRSEAALLSISVDNCTVPAWVAIILIIFVLFCTFTLCSYMGI
ncbi:hypothetical protein HF086_007119 [Spodoptera exigua]|uniref:Prolactin regulatory element-binding protein n=1 Tax=Spodoptera exigua TaxID=7107 RepID=A0A922SF85_SPOEX|nr:hypothetical protein HF086_007119 [Spodoptera exigua]